MSNDINNGSMLRIGAILHGTYRIDGYLSSGGFGNTYVVTNVQFDEQYAIKEFFMRGITQRDGNSTTVSVSNINNESTFISQMEKFKKEARRLRKLQNEHIVRVYDLFEENGTAYYVMDFIDGENLKLHLERLKRPMTEVKTLDILRQVLDALATAHSGNIWHLDLKPANIMVDNRGQVKLIDFGASKQQSQSGGATTSTAVSYTQGYAPREQMEQNLDKFGPWSDFYAIGATLYTLLTNRKPPMPSDIDDDVTVDKCEALPLPVSEKMKRLVLWLMETNRNRRPQQVSEILAYLDRDINDNAIDDDATVVSQPVKPEPPKDANPNSEGEKKNKRKILIPIAAGVVLCAVIGFSVKGCEGKEPSQALYVDSPVVNTVATSNAVADTASYVTRHKCYVSQGGCTYTGYVNQNGIPEGEGEACFDDDRYYKGKYVNGKMVADDAFFRYPNGDTYQGSFVDDHFSRGRYTVNEDKSYFVGIFDSKGQPKKGKWYSKNGTMLEAVE